MRDLLEDLYAKTATTAARGTKCHDFFYPDCDEADSNNSPWSQESNINAAGLLERNDEKYESEEYDDNYNIKDMLDDEIYNPYSEEMTLPERNYQTDRIGNANNYQKGIYRKPTALNHQVLLPFAVYDADKPNKSSFDTAHKFVEKLRKDQLSTNEVDIFDQAFFEGELGDIENLYNELSKHSEELWALHSLKKGNLTADDTVWNYYSGEGTWGHSKALFNNDGPGQRWLDSILFNGLDDLLSQSAEGVLTAFNVLADTGGVVDIDLDSLDGGV